jgi:hypothetical protein
MARQPVDFRALKEITFQQAIDFLSELKLYKREGDQMRFACPACGGDDKRALSINPEKGFRCFEGNKTGTDAVALVAHVRGISQYDAGRILQDHFLSGQKPARAPSAASSALDGRREPLQAPLDYLVHEHPVADLLGLSAATLEALGGGYAPKGTMAGRLLIPLRMEDGRLVGYLGIATKEDQEPLLRFPDNLEERCTAQPKVEVEEKPQPDQLRKLFRVV